MDKDIKLLRDYVTDASLEDFIKWLDIKIQQVKDLKNEKFIEAFTVLKYELILERNRRKYVR